MEKLDLNSELLRPMKEQLEIILNRLTNVVATNNKEAEIVLKISLDSQHLGDTNQEGDYIEWTEPRINYQITEKIKEVKNTNKGDLGYDYELKINEQTNDVYVEKINKQLSIDEMEE